jgi:hypothetical protein
VVKLYVANVEVLREKETHDELNLSQKLMVSKFSSSTLNANLFCISV